MDDTFRYSRFVPLSWYTCPPIRRMERIHAEQLSVRRHNLITLELFGDGTAHRPYLCLAVTLEQSVGIFPGPRDRFNCSVYRVAASRESNVACNTGLEVIRPRIDGTHDWSS